MVPCGGTAQYRKGHRHRNSAPPFRSLTEAEAALLVEICEQIVPRDDTPGATEAGVIHYIDRQLAGPLARHAETYRRGLDAFRLTCQQRHHQPFVALPAERKIELLRQLENGQAPRELWREPTAQAFFALVVTHTMQGFYGSPRHGGNRGYASYRLLGLDYPQVLGRNRRPRTKA